MFGPSKRDMRRLEARLDELADRLSSGLASVRSHADGRVDDLVAQVGATPEERTAALVAAVPAGLGQQLTVLLEHAAALERAASDVEERLAAARGGHHAPRVAARLNVVHQADAHGYVSLFFDGGYTDKVDLLAGTTDPPTELVCNLNTTNDINSYAGCVVRPGEYWLARSKRGDRSGVKCVYTPFF